MFHVASTFDERGEQQFLTTHYHYCKRCRIIRQRNMRELAGEITTHEAILEKLPAVLLVELLAGIRAQDGRGTSLLTINKRWWNPRRYPLVSGNLLGIETPRVRPLYHHSQPETRRIVDAEAQRITPMPRYTPLTEPKRNPFTSRRGRIETDHSSLEATDVEPVSPSETSTSIPPIEADEEK
jgi:hypothetical protein